MALVDGRRAHEELGLSRAAFVDMCILCGTDFSSTLKKVGPITALRLIREHGSIERVLERCAFRARPGFAPAAARAVFLADPRPPPPIASRRELELLARAPDPAAVAALLGDSHPPPAGSDPFSARTVPL
ncbi:hypothetical protein H4R19_006815 [Coemansia spiralis]|nr:hypothetical protein H4R19_006815 [Coemansia spiralis]